MKAKYVNPFTDFGFKKIFAEEASKPLLIDFLNALLNNEKKIESISFKSTEQLGFTVADRKAVYDIYCEDEMGEKFIVELQKVKQNYFKDRTIYYSTFPIVEQAEKGDWNYKLSAVYCIGILDFTFDTKEEESNADVVHTIKLKNQHGKVFYDKLSYIYLEMPNFIKTEEQLTSRLDQWLYFIKHLEDFEVIPTIFKDTVFTQAFETAELAKFSEAQRHGYEMSLKVFRDNFNTFEFAKDESERLGREKGMKEGLEEGLVQGLEQGLVQGLEQGMEQGKIEGLEEGLRKGREEGVRNLKSTAQKLKLLGMSLNEILLMTGLSEDDLD